MDILDQVSSLVGAYGGSTAEVPSDVAPSVAGVEKILSTEQQLSAVDLSPLVEVVEAISDGEIAKFI